MSLLEAVIRALIWICCVVLAVYLVVWVLGALGLAIPAMVMKVVWVIVVLLCILVLLRVLVPPLRSSWPWF